ncbi:MAG: hypothetical protein APR63_05785 [Desulfuromonas sp. SDB]|nr:MAG: hypothetical protein APR63_05785 [Desulfuromonas sp. SDB]
MNEKNFEKFLKIKGKKSSVIDRNIRTIQKFNEYIIKNRGKKIQEVNSGDIKAYVDDTEKEKKSAKGTLYVLMNYFKFKEDNDLLKYTSRLRRSRTEKTRRIFPICKFMGINKNYVKKLEDYGIMNVEQMLQEGKTGKQRKELSTKLNIPEKIILELVKLSDLTRLGYVKTKLTRLYYDAGLDSPDKIAKFKPDELHEFFVKFVKESGWDGMVPNPSDLVHNIESARKLDKIVEE